MAHRAYLLARLAVLVIASFVLVAACGRSNLDDYVLSDAGAPDGGDDASEGGNGCNAQTCPLGCCDSNGQCQGGDSLAACGNGGETCANCTAGGFQFCDPNLKACANRPTVCDNQTCGSGCCENGLCLAGSDPNECGNSGGACQHCAQQGLACVGKSCQVATCGPGNCNGCCFGNQCVQGLDNTSCGSGGQQCANCTAQSLTCVPSGQGGTCKGTPGCSPQNCAGGCCDQFGNCNMGTSDQVCGVNGSFCQNCLQQGEQCQFQRCVPSMRCSPQTCPGGCCDQVGNCVPGTIDPQCGRGGQFCQNCLQQGETCQFQSCQPQFGCNPQTCPGGCCQGNACFGGGDNMACGTGGQQCKDCALGGLVCNGSGFCIPPPPLCNPQNCASGCCIGNVCAVGNQDTNCGKGGAQCQNCTAFNDVCTAQTCVPKPPPVCNAMNCNGCCDPQGNCQPGFLNNLCGENGVACVNCAAQGSTCDTGVMPRVCTNMQMTCPSPYPMCPANVITPSPPIQHVCAPADLANARNACGAGAHTSGCQSFFSFEQSQKPACAACLQQFDTDFQEFTGLLTCAAPFVSAQCDHITGCITDCENKSCSMCAPGAVSQCRSSVQNGQCRQYFQQGQCIAQAFFGPGAFCNPQNYGGQYGAWLQGVGGHYCQ